MAEESLRITKVHDADWACDKECLVCATFFEFNITGEEFRKLWVEVGGEEFIADHMWSKFHGYDHSILRLMGAADGNNRGVITRLVNEWCAKHPKDWKKR